MTEKSPVLAANAGKSATEVPRFTEPGAASPRVDAGAADNLVRPASPQADFKASDRDRLLPRSLYRSINLTCWLLAIIAGLAAWWMLFSLF